MAVINIRVMIRVMLIGLIGLSATHLTWSQVKSAEPRKGSKERARVVLSKELSKFDGNHLKVSLVEVNYGPGEASAPHSHPCAVFGYVVSGTFRTQVKGEPEMIYKAGASFYDTPNGIHLISANASTTEPATLVAYLICDHDAPLSLDVVEPTKQKETAQ